MANPPRRPTTTRDIAEAAFKAATTRPVEAPVEKRPVIPAAKEQVTLRLDREVLDHFQKDGPGWQDRIADALRQLVRK
jgi:uncharacterized protein (DUF4415 family)